MTQKTDGQSHPGARVLCDSTYCRWRLGCVLARCGSSTSPLPLTALNDALRAGMMDGTGLLRLGTPRAVVAGSGTVSFVVALTIVRWR